MRKYGIISPCEHCKYGYRQSHGGCEYEDALYVDQCIPPRLIADKNKSESVIACKNFEESYD